MAVRKDKDLVTKTWFAQWPIGNKAILARHHVVIVAHEKTQTGWPLLRCEEEVTGRELWCFYGERDTLHKPMNVEGRR